MLYRVWGERKCREPVRTRRRRGHRVQLYRYPITHAVPFGIRFKLVKPLRIRFRIL